LLQEFYLFSYNKMKTIITIPIVLFYIINPVQGFLNNNPLKKIALTRALQSSVMEIITLNVFDQTSLLQQLVCDCEENKYLGVYVIGSVYFGYCFWTNLHSESKISNVPSYYNSKRWIKQLLLMLFLILGKNINNAI